MPGGRSFFAPADVVTSVRYGSMIAGVGALTLIAAAPLALLVLHHVTARLAEIVPVAAPVRPDV